MPGEFLVGYDPQVYAVVHGPAVVAQSGEERNFDYCSVKIEHDPFAGSRLNESSEVAFDGLLIGVGDVEVDIGGFESRAG